MGTVENAISLWDKTFEETRKECNETFLKPIEKLIEKAITKRLDDSITYDLGEFTDDTSRRYANCALRVFKTKGFTAEIKEVLTDYGQVRYQLTIGWL